MLAPGPHHQNPALESGVRRIQKSHYVIRPNKHPGRAPSGFLIAPNYEGPDTPMLTTYLFVKCFFFAQQFLTHCKMRKIEKGDWWALLLQRGGKN